MSRMILYLAFIYVGHIVTLYIKRYMYLYLASDRTTGSFFLYIMSYALADILGILRCRAIQVC